MPKGFFEEHHILGRNHDPDLTVLLCHNCHFLVHEGYLRAGVDLSYEPDPQKRVAKMLRALAAFFEMLAKAFLQWAALLDEHKTKHVEP